MNNHSLLLFLCILLTISNSPLLVSSERSCDQEDHHQPGDGNASSSSATILKYKLIAIAAILVSGALGISLPILGKRYPSIQPGSKLFFVIKSFAAGVILSTGFVHILPDAFESLTSPCLVRTNPVWENFPFAGFIPMFSAILTMMIEVFATRYYEKLYLGNTINVRVGDEEESRTVDVGGGHSHGHTHAAFSCEQKGVPVDDHHLFRHRIISQVLELGIVVHSVIIGISLGASDSAKVIKPLVAALCFHQFFEGMGLGGVMSQANFKFRAVVVMVLFFSLTTPIGIAIGIGISHVYDENSPTALVIGGVLDSAAAGILIYMALVDLLAQDSRDPRVQGNLRLMLGTNCSLLLGMGCMSLLAKWA